MFEVANADAVGCPCFTIKLGVIPCDDLHQRRFTSTVDADDGDLGAGQELQVDIIEHWLGSAGKGLGQPLHNIGILHGHGSDLSGLDNTEFCRPSRV